MERGVRFVRFDALKYADMPLRRNFVSAVASELGCKQTQYRRDLYSGRTKTEIKVPPGRGLLGHAQERSTTVSLLFTSYRR